MGLPMALWVWALSQPGLHLGAGAGPPGMRVAQCQPGGPWLWQAWERGMRRQIPPGMNTRAPPKGLAISNRAVKFPALHNFPIYSELLSMTNSHLLAESK